MEKLYHLCKKIAVWHLSLVKTGPSAQSFLEAQLLNGRETELG